MHLQAHTSTPLHLTGLCLHPSVVVQVTRLDKHKYFTIAIR